MAPSLTITRAKARHFVSVIPQLSRPAHSRLQSTLSSNPSIHVFSDPQKPGRHVLSYLTRSPPSEHLAIGTTTSLPPTPSSFTENPSFVRVLQEVISRHATRDPQVQASALSFASQGGSGLGSGGAFFPGQTKQRAKRRATAGDGPSGHGGAGGAARGGFVHVADNRNPPDWGRVAWPEDIFGSVEVDAQGQFVGENGGYRESGTYRLITNDGILGLSEFMEGKVKERLTELESELKERGL